jgi:hypothetical protein
MGNDINIGSDYFTLKSSTVIRMNEEFVVYSEEGPIVLRTRITADFENIPPKYHEIFINVLTSKYMNKVNFGENPFSECKPIVRRKWWQFWKSQYFTK